MNKATFINFINLEYPDGFKELSDIENKKYFSGDMIRLSFHNEEKHVLLSLSKSKYSFMNNFINARNIANGAITNLRRNLKDFSFVEEYKSKILGQDAVTECFSYMANDQDIKQYAEMSVFKIKKQFYVVYCLCRDNSKEEYKKIFKEFRESFTAINS